MKGASREPPLQPTRSSRRSRRAPRRGTYAVIVALLVIPLLGFLALSVDLSYVRFSADELRIATEAAAHAGAVNLRATQNAGDAAAEAAYMLGLHEVAGAALDPATSSDVDVGRWDGASFSAATIPANAVRVTVDRSTSRGQPLSLFLAGLFGVSSSNLSVSPVAAIRNSEVIVVLDVYRNSAGFVNALAFRQGLRDLVTAFGNRGPADALGLVTVVGMAANGDEVRAPWTPLTYMTGWGAYSAVLNKWTSAVNPITTCNGASTATWMPRCDAPTPPAGEEGNNLADGIRLALEEFDAYGDPEALQTIVLVTNLPPTHPSGSGFLTDAMRFDAVDAADEAWSGSTHVHLSVIHYNPTMNLPAAIWMEGLVRGTGVYTQVTDLPSLRMAFRMLAEDTPVALVQ